MLDNSFIPAAYIFTATPYMFLAIMLVYILAFRLHTGLPVSGAYAFSVQPSWTYEFATSFRATGFCRSSRCSLSSWVAGRSECAT